MSEQTPQDPAPQDTQEPVAQEKQTAPESAPSFLKDDGTWNREVFGELAEHSVFDKYKTPTDTIKGVINAQQLLGKRAEDWWQSDDPEVQKRRNEIMGIPESPELYEFEFPEGFEPDEEAIVELKNFFKDIGIPKEKAAKLVEYDLNRIQTLQKQQEDEQLQGYEEAMKSLRSEWKDKTDYNMSKAVDILRHIGMDEYADDLENNKNPLVVKFAKDVFDKIRPLVDNDELLEARQAQSLASAEDTLSAIENEMINYPQEKLYDPHYNDLMKRREEILQKIA